MTVRGAAKTKVVILVHLVGPGGGETMAVESAIGLDAERFERVLCLGRWHELEEVEPTAGMLRGVEASGARILRLRRKSRYDLRAWLPLIRLLRRERVEILHGHMFGSNVWACVIGRLARVPVIVCHEHMWSYGGGRLRAWVDRWLIARWSDAFIAVSEAGLRSMIEVERIRPQDVALLRNGVPMLPTGDPDRVREELSIGAGQPVIVTVGSLRPEKAYEVLVEAAASLAPSQPGLRVLIAGEGPERPKLESLIGELGMTEVVTLLGVRADVPDLLAAADLAVCCSDFEGGPLAVMEYMGAELPVIATRVGGLPELIRDGENGALVPPRDSAALAEGAQRLLADPALRQRLGRAGRELRERDYGIDAYIRRLEDLYSRLLAEA
jgi:glycosyltransferase involved in cell wall biosynthesis